MEVKAPESRRKSLPEFRSYVPRVASVACIGRSGACGGLGPLTAETFSCGEEMESVRGPDFAGIGCGSRGFTSSWEPPGRLSSGVGVPRPRPALGLGGGRFREAECVKVMARELTGPGEGWVRGTTRGA